jgi:hypothetical protein
MISGEYRCPLYDGDAAATTTDLGTDQATHQLDSSLWSLASGPARTVHVPVESPAPPEPPTATRTPIGVTIITAGLPPSTLAMIAPYFLDIYRFTAAVDPDDRYVRLATLNTAAGVIEYSDPSPTPADRYDLVLVDPIGRRSPPARLDAPE